ncbi:MAG: ADP-forming succinate--CoA ligase subunit beta [Gammaproteobacteria bacterium CG22_combo_CG10-13_8_21_14_all_40_8]|nr:MAG: ADP-forming succinate--CoA ligase subunit beta [Gammaproteobacteria bacterium CG22_combo_CG10-13_8_21_14_all_40_8]
MNLHEYQAKKLFSDFGMPVSLGIVARTVDEALVAADSIASNKWVVKAQVYAGGRGKGGGVKIVSSRNELAEAVKSMLGTNLVTPQTDEKGLPIHRVLIEAPCDIDRELYVGAVIDRETQRVVIMASTEGGVEIEKVAEETPEKIVKVVVNPMTGVLPYQCRDIAFALKLEGNQIKQFTKLLMGLGQLIIAKDLSLVEINPLVVTKQGDLLCLDAKMNIDDNALFRHPELREMHDATQEDARELRAAEWELNYIALEGDIGCMVNGAGLAMATMDIIKLHGGQPANFLDVGGGATKERVAEAFKIILSDTSVKGILVNIFGGIVRCDLIADGIIAAVKEVGITIPVVVRLEGNNAQLGAQKLAESGLNLTPAVGLTDAAKKIVAKVGE